jgi:hypothetical protein
MDAALFVKRFDLTEDKKQHGGTVDECPPHKHTQQPLFVDREVGIPPASGVE